MLSISSFFCFHHIQDLQCRGKRFDQLIPPPPLARSSSRQGRCLVSEPRTAEAGRSGQESAQSELIRDCAVDGTWSSGVSVDVAIRSRSSWEESREIAAASGYSAILYAAPHITTARHSASPPKVSMVMLRRLRRGRLMQGILHGRRRSPQYATLRMNELLSTNYCSVNRSYVSGEYAPRFGTTAN